MSWLERWKAAHPEHAATLDPSYPELIERPGGIDSFFEWEAAVAEITEAAQRAMLALARDAAAQPEVAEWGRILAWALDQDALIATEDDREYAMRVTGAPRLVASPYTVAKADLELRGQAEELAGLPTHDDGAR